jgi:hypothetical protein
MEKCRACGGTGRCADCHGTGMVGTMKLRHGECGGTGKCANCRGTGKK